MDSKAPSLKGVECRLKRIMATRTGFETLVFCRVGNGAATSYPSEAVEQHNLTEMSPVEVDAKKNAVFINADCSVPSIAFIMFLCVFYRLYAGSPLKLNTPRLDIINSSEAKGRADYFVLARDANLGAAHMLIDPYLMLLEILCTMNVDRVANVIEQANINSKFPTRRAIGGGLEIIRKMKRKFQSDLERTFDPLVCIRAIEGSVIAMKERWNVEWRKKKEGGSEDA